MTIRIHLAEDDLLLADGYASALRQAGYEVDVTHDGISTDKRLIQHTYHLLILDLGLPGLDGTDVLKRLRLRTSQTPVLVISAREALEERVKLLNLGADDYLVKPIALSELEARVRALIRRLQPDEESLISVGDLSIDTRGKRAWIKEQMLDLTSREWSALTFLAARMNRIVGKDQIMQSLYDWDAEITENAIEKTISRLRSKLEPAGIVIRTVRGLGYYLEKPNAAS
jgi:two-component system, OmpR family, response regulator